MSMVQKENFDMLFSIKGEHNFFQRYTLHLKAPLGQALHWCKVLATDENPQLIGTRRQKQHV